MRHSEYHPSLISTHVIDIAAAHALREIRLNNTDLLDDNHSQKARSFIEEHNDAKEHGELTIFLTCGDAKGAFAPFTDSVEIGESRSIGAVYPPEIYAFLLGHRGSGAIVVSSHFDGTTLATSPIPQGCGGLAAKLDVLERSVNPEGGILRYVHQRIESPDAIIQAHISAARVAQLLRKLSIDKPVIASTTDYISGRIYPLAVLESNGTLSSGIYDLDNPEKMYENGIPEVEEEALPKKIRYLLERNKHVADELNRVFPGFAESQRVQNPHTVCITTTTRPLAIRYPGHFYAPNRGFSLSLPYTKTGDREIMIAREDFEEVANQAEYPISRSRNARPGESFHSTRNLLIETPYLAESRRIAHYLMQYPWMQEWMNMGDRQILVAQIKTADKTRSPELLPGQTERIEVFIPKVA